MAGFVGEGEGRTNSIICSYILCVCLCYEGIKKLEWTKYTRMVNGNAIDLKIFCQFSFSLSSGEISSNIKTTSFNSNNSLSQGVSQISSHNLLQSADV